MAQFDVLENPITRARRLYPYVAVLQSDDANTGRDRIAAPLARPTHVPGVAGRLTPQVSIGGTQYVLLVPALTAMPVGDAINVRGQLASHRSEIVAALDFLFLGV